MRKRALRPNHVWSYDFVEDRTEKNRKLRMLVVIDEFTRESLAIEVAWSFKAAQVIEVLGYLFAVRGVPEHSLADFRGEQGAGAAVLARLLRAGVARRGLPRRTLRAAHTVRLHVARGRQGARNFFPVVSK